MSFDFISSGKRTLTIEQQAIAGLELDTSFTQACELMLSCRGKIITMGIGKSGHVAGKVAATLASTGSAAFFVHPAEASHGDLGMISAQDVLVLFSHSGASEEILALMPLIKRMGWQTIALTGAPDSAIAQRADVHIHIRIDQEACPLDLAPSASTTAALAMGDALAIALLEARGFNRDDFARSHPGGRLGRRLLVKISDLMHTGADLPLVSSDTLVPQALLVMTEKKLGLACVVDAAGKLVGIYTDGDLRRSIDSGCDLNSTRIDSVMTPNPQTIASNALAVEAVALMEAKSINAVVSLDESGRVQGVLNMLDLLRARVV